MKDIALIALVAIVALVALVMIDGNPTAAFVSRSPLKILNPVNPPESLCDIEGICNTPNCPTGLVRMQVYEGPIPRYQYAVVPQNILGSALGKCCREGTSFTFSASQEGELKTMQLQCAQGNWKAFMN